VTLTGGDVTAYVGSGFKVAQSGGFVINNLTGSGTRIKQSGSLDYAIDLASIVGGSLAGLISTAASFEAMRIASCTQFRVSGGSYVSAGATSISTSGTCTGSFIDRTVYWGTSSTKMANSATGLNIEWRISAVPATGTWAVGDAAEQSVPVVGNPKRWRCTVAGVPGTWVSEGNL
jgi:hypothetical protein